MQQPSRASTLLAALVTLSALLACKKTDSSAEGTGTGAAAVAEPPAGTTFTKEVPKVGTKRNEESKTDLSFNIKFKRAGKVIHGGDFEKTDVEKTRSEVLAVSDDAVTKVRVTFIEKYAAEGSGKGAPKKKSSPVTGKTYEVEAVGGKLVITREGGKPMSAAERKVVEKELKSLGKPDKMSAFIPNRPLIEGEKLPVTQAIVREMFGGGDDEDEVSVDQATFTFRGTRNEGGKTHGLFDASLKITVSPKGEDMGMLMGLTGKLVVDAATSQVLQVSLKGPITMRGKDTRAQGELEGEGSMSTSVSATYE
jgi:hypothetical protein